MPRISVIVSVYNSEKHLRQCLDSILCQTLRDIEIICVNDGSTDSSLGILEEYAEKDRRMQIITKANEGMGAASARNRGLDFAEGEYLSILDSDDWFEPNMLSSMASRADETDADVVIANCVYFNDKTGETTKAVHVLDAGFLPKKHVFSRKDCPGTLFQISYGFAWNKLFRRSFVEKTKIRFQRIRYTDDAYFVYSHMALADRIAVVNEPLINYRIEVDSSQTSSIAQTPDSSYIPYVTLKATFQEYGIYEELKQSLANRAADTMRHFYDTVKTFECFKYLHEKYKSEVFDTLGFDEADEDFFHDKNHYLWYKLVSENSAEEVAFSAAHSYGALYATYIHRNRFPYDLVQRGSRVVIYGAQARGEFYFAQALFSKYCEVVLWVDDDVQGVSYIAPSSEISGKDFDAILISYTNEAQVNQAKKRLQELNVSNDRIIG